MVPIRNSVICCLLILNIVGISLNIFFIINGYQLRILEEESQISYKQYNLRGSKLKINRNNFFGISKLNENIFKKNVRLLRIHSFENYEILIEVLNGFCFYLFIILMISFCISDNQEQFKFHFDLDISGFFTHIENPVEILMIPFIIVIYLAVYMIIYLLTVGIVKALGKKNSRYCSLIFVSIVEIGMSIVCFIMVKEKDAFIVMGSIYSALAVFNFLAISIPNLSCEEKLRSQDFKVFNNQNQNFIVNNNSDNYNNKDDSSNMQNYLNTYY